MIRGALVVITVVLLAALASVQAQQQVSDVNPNAVARSWLRARLAEEDRKVADMRASSHHTGSSSSIHQHSESGLPSSVARSIADQIDRSDLASMPIPYTKKFYLTFGPYYAENPLSVDEKKNLRQFDGSDASWMMGG